MITPAQHRVAVLYAGGLPLPVIAERMNIGIGSVRRHVRELAERIGTRDRRKVAEILPKCTVGVTWPVNTMSLARGDPIRITGGRFAGREGTYYASSNTEKVRVIIGGARFFLQRKYVVRA